MTGSEYACPTCKQSIDVPWTDTRAEYLQSLPLARPPRFREEFLNQNASCKNKFQRALLPCRQSIANFLYKTKRFFTRKIPGCVGTVGRKILPEKVQTCCSRVGRWFSKISKWCGKTKNALVRKKYALEEWMDTPGTLGYYAFRRVYCCRCWTSCEHGDASNRRSVCVKPLYWMIGAVSFLGVAATACQMLWLAKGGIAVTLATEV
jgi:hypothetical protein